MTRAELAARLSGTDRKVMQMALAVRSGAGFDTEKAFMLLFDWCRNFLQNPA